MTHKCPTNSQWKCPAAREALALTERAVASQGLAAGMECITCKENFFSVIEWRRHHSTKPCMTPAQMREARLAKTAWGWWVDVSTEIENAALEQDDLLGIVETDDNDNDDLI
jgi:hypothetical protein